MPLTLRLATESDGETLISLMREYYVFDGHHFDAGKPRVALLGPSVATMPQRSSTEKRDFTTTTTIS